MADATGRNGNRSRENLYRRGKVLGQGILREGDADMKILVYILAGLGGLSVAVMLCIVVYWLIVDALHRHRGF